MTQGSPEQVRPAQEVWGKLASGEKGSFFSVKSHPALLPETSVGWSHTVRAPSGGEGEAKAIHHGVLLPTGSSSVWLSLLPVPKRGQLMEREGLQSSRTWPLRGFPGLWCEGGRDSPGEISQGAGSGGFYLMGSQRKLCRVLMCVHRWCFIFFSILLCVLAYEFVCTGGPVQAQRPEERVWCLAAHFLLSSFPQAGSHQEPEACGTPRIVPVSCPVLGSRLAQPGSACLSAGLLTSVSHLTSLFPTASPLSCSVLLTRQGLM